MKQKTRLFAGGFAIACIIIMAFTGFLLVDQSTDRYMPGVFGPMFLISSISGDGVDFAVMGEQYLLSAESVRGAQETLWEYRALIPGSVRLAGALAVQLYDAVCGLLG